MRKISAISAILVFLSVPLFCADNAFAGAWTVPKYKVWGEYYMKWSYAKDSYNSEWKLTSTQSSGVKDSRTQYFEMEPKLEFGVTDWLTALGGVVYKQGIYKEYQRPAGWGPYAVKNHGVTAAKLGARWRLMDVPFVLSSQTKVSIYTGYGINRGATGDNAYQPSIGYGNDSVEERIMIGKLFSVPLTDTYRLPCYASAEVGYKWNNRTVANGYLWFIEGGFWPVPWFLIKSELDAYKTQDGTGKFEEAYGIWRIGGIWQVFGGDSILRQGNKLFNLEFDYGLTVWGKNTTAFQEFVFKVDVQF